jgi:hypothetical protein
MGETEVVDDIKGHRFVAGFGEEESELVYRLAGKRMLLLHTWVPDKSRRRGIAGSLVQAAIDRAAADELIVVPLCPYTRHWLEQNPEAAATVTIDWER